MGYTTSSRDTLVIRSIVVIDGTGREPTGPMTVVIADGRIVAIQPDEVQTPSGAIEVDGTGRVLMPGLIETHAHYEDWMGETLLLNGVTTILDAAAVYPLPWTFAQQAGSRDGRIFGPRVLIAGPAIHGASTAAQGASNYPRWAPLATQPGQARTAARALVADGVDCLKAYMFLTPESIAEIAEVADEAGIPSLGHISVSARAAARSGLRAIAHGSGLIQDVVPPEILARHDPLSVQLTRTLTPDWPNWFNLADDGLVDETIAELVELGTFLEPDMIHTGGRGGGLRAAEYDIEDREFFDDPRKEYIPAAFRAETTRYRTLYGWTALNADELARARDGLARLWAIYAEFHRRGGRLLIASGQGHLLPGVSMHRELELAVDIGLTPLEAIHAATGRAAEYLRKPEIGVIAEGKLADLVILDGDPLEDIRATRSVAQVIQHGRLVEMEYHPWHANPIASPPREFNFGRGTPVIDELQPPASPAGDAVELTVVGRFFAPHSRVEIDGSPVPTRFVDEHHLVAAVPASVVAAAHLARVVVVRPEPTEVRPVSDPAYWVITFATGGEEDAR